jgi:hypothetical protein
MERLTNTRYSSEKISREKLTHIQGDRIEDFMIRNHEELQVQL